MSELDRLIEDMEQREQWLEDYEDLERFDNENYPWDCQGGTDTVDIDLDTEFPRYAD